MNSAHPFAKFRIGQRVRIHGTSGAHIDGTEGVVTLIDYGTKYGIRVDIDQELDVEFWFSDSELEPVDPR